jgi:hypothetical protein
MSDGYSHLSQLLAPFGAVLQPCSNICSNVQTDFDSTPSDRSKYKGMMSKMSSRLFVAEVTMLKDALRVLKQLSLYFQNQQADVVEVHSRIVHAMVVIESFKEKRGISVQKFIDTFKATGAFKGVRLRKCDNDNKKFLSMIKQFNQGLYDNMKQRFSTNNFLIKVQIFDKSNWPDDSVEKALYGERNMQAICKDTGFSAEHTVDILYEYAEFEKNGKMRSKLQALRKFLAVYPISTADCERAFSMMNLQQTDIRNSLKTETVDSLLIISINGPALRFWQPRQYVLSWLKEGHREALDKASGLT